MSTYQNQNQFNQTPELGQVDFTVNPNVKSAKINPSSSGGALLQAGQAVKLITGTSAEVLVDIVSGVTDKAYGVIIYNPRKNLYSAGDTVEIACRGTVVYLETSAAVNRGAKVQLDPTGPTVATLASLGTNVMVGTMLDQPAAANVLARVEIDPQDANLSAY